MRDIVLIAHDIRSCHNVGSLLRTAEGLGVSKVIFTGYTPYPTDSNDTRLPHISAKLTQQISKTALGAESLQAWEHVDDITVVLKDLKDEGYALIGLEQSPTATPLPQYHGNHKIALLLGREVEGIETVLLAAMDECIFIPMYGEKESFNVVQAAAMALYALRFRNTD